MKKLTETLINVITTKSKVKELLEEIIKSENQTIKLIIKEFNDPFNSYTENNNIYIKESLLKNIDFSNNLSTKGNIYWLIKNIYHELAHINQENQVNQGILSDASMFYITTNIINDYLDSEDYVRNYKYQEIEINANQTAWQKVLELLDDDNQFTDIVKQINQEIIYLEYLELFLNRTTKENKIVSVLKMIPTNLNTVIKENPQLLEQYQNLSNFYKKNGMPKSIIEILTNINLIDYYDNTKLWLNRMFFLRVINQDLTELKKVSEDTKKRYIDLFNKMSTEITSAINRLETLITPEKNFSVQEYQRYILVLNNKKNELKEIK